MAGNQSPQPMHGVWWGSGIGAGLRQATVKVPTLASIAYNCTAEVRMRGASEVCALFYCVAIKHNTPCHAVQCD